MYGTQCQVPDGPQQHLPVKKQTPTTRVLGGKREGWKIWGINNQAMYDVYSKKVSIYLRWDMYVDQGLGDATEKEDNS